MKLEELENIIENKIISEGAAAEGIQYEKDIGKVIANALANYNLKEGIDFFITAAGAGHGSDVSVMAKDKKTLVTGIEAKTSMGSDHGQFRFMYDIKGKGKNKFVLNEGTKEFKVYSPEIKDWTRKLWKQYAQPALSAWEDPDPVMLALGVDFFGWGGNPTTLRIKMPEKSELAAYPPAARNLLKNLREDEYGSTYEFTFPGRYIKSINSAYTGTKKKGFVCKKGNQCVYLVDWFNVPSSFWYRSGQRIVKEYFTNLWKDLSAPAPFGEVGKKYKQKNDDFIQGGDIGLWALNTKSSSVNIPRWEGTKQLEDKISPYLRLYWKTSGSSLAEGGQRPLNAAIKFKGRPTISPTNLLPIVGKKLTYGNPRDVAQFYEWLQEQIIEANNNISSPESIEVEVVPESLTNTKITYKMLEQMVEETIKKAR